MSSRCCFCNQTICWGEVNLDGKFYHDKCTPQARGVDAEFQVRVKEEEEKRKAEFDQQPKELGAVELEESGGGGFTVDPLTGKKKPLKEGQRFANPRVGAKQKQ